MHSEPQWHMIRYCVLNMVLVNIYTFEIFSMHLGEARCVWSWWQLAPLFSVDLSLIARWGWLTHWVVRVLPLPSFPSFAPVSLTSSALQLLRDTVLGNNGVCFLPLASWTLKILSSFFFSLFSSLSRQENSVHIFLSLYMHPSIPVSHSTGHSAMRFPTSAEQSRPLRGQLKTHGLPKGNECVWS